MRGSIGLLGIAGLAGFIAAAQAQTPSGFDGTYRFVSSANVNATYTAHNGQTGPCPARRAGPLHIENGKVRYTTTTGYKLKGTVGPDGQLQLSLTAPPNTGNAGSNPLDFNVSGQLDGTGTVHVRQTSNSCSYDFVWQKVP